MFVAGSRTWMYASMLSSDGASKIKNFIPAFSMIEGWLTSLESFDLYAAMLLWSLVLRG